VGSNQPLGGSRIWARLLVALIAFGAICNIAQAGTLAKPFVAKNSPLGFGRNSVAICVGVEAIQALRTHQENAGFLGELASDDAYATRGIATPSLEAEVDAAFGSGQLRSGTMVQFSDSGGALAGSGPKQGTGAIWYHDNIKITGAGPGGATVELRTHAPNPGAPPGSYSQSNYTTQINTSNGRYLLPEGTWKTIPSMTDAERAAAHYPAGN